MRPVRIGVASPGRRRCGKTAKMFSVARVRLRHSIVQPADLEKVVKLASACDKTATLRGATLLDIEVARGTRLAFALSVPGAAVDDPVRHLVWRGAPASVQFGVAIPLDRPPGDGDGERPHRPYKFREVPPPGDW